MNFYYVDHTHVCVNTYSNELCVFKSAHCKAKVYVCTHTCTHSFWGYGHFNIECTSEELFKSESRCHQNNKLWESKCCILSLQNFDCHRNFQTAV